MVEQILQIIPTPPHNSDGIGDYALMLATQLLTDWQIDTHFLVFRNDLEVATSVNGFAMQRLTTHTAAAFCAVIPADIRVIVIHFSGYPYFDTSLKGTFGSGTPFWLIDGLRSIVATHRLKLIVMFHELPKLHWQQFYVFDLLNPIHSTIARRLARMADAILTSSTKYQAILAAWSGTNVTKVSIFSSMGEPEVVPPLAARHRRLIIFGGAARSRIYQNHFPALITSCKSLGIHEIYDIGPSLNLPAPPSDIKLIEVGFCSQLEISQLLITAMVGCLDYSPFPGNLEKSSVFAAYCAHGLLPILTQSNRSEACELYLDRHYLVLSSQLDNSRIERLQSIADRARNWYQDHTIKEVAKIFYNCI